MAQLETLDLSQGTFGDDGANAILENADAYRHLKTIDLTHHFVSDELSLRLAKLGPNVILEEGGGSDEPDDRYVAVSE